MSPSGDSTLTTSAPRSASMRAAKGPANTRERSRTRSAERGDSTLRLGAGRRSSAPPFFAGRKRRSRRRAEGVLLRVHLLNLDIARQDRTFPRLVLGLARMELRHHLASKELKARADVLVGVVAGLIQQDDLIDVRLLKFSELPSQSLGRPDEP